MDTLRLVVVTGLGLADGFRLAGAATLIVRHEPEAPGILRALVGQEDIGLVMVTDDVWRGVPEQLRGTLENLARPIVLRIPVGLPSNLATRRSLIGETLQRAIGHRIQLPGESRPSVGTAAEEEAW